MGGPVKDFDWSTAVDVTDKETPAKKPLDFDWSTATPVDDPGETVFVPEDRKAYKLPSGLDGAESDFVIQTDIKKKPRNVFFGMIEDRLDADENIAKGLASWIAKDAPRNVLGLVREQTDKMNQEPDWYNDASAFMKMRTLGLPSLSPADDPFIRLLAKKTGLAERLKTATDTLMQKHAKMVEGLNLEPTNKTRFSKFFFDLGQTGGSVAASIGAATVFKSPAAAAVMFGGLQKGSLYNEARDKGKDVETASGVSTLGGIAEGSLEFVGVSKFMSIAKYHKPLTRVIGRMAEEALQEMSQTTAEAAITNLSGVRKQNVREVLQQVGYSGLIGLIASAPTASVMTHAEEKHVSQLTEMGVPEPKARELVAHMIENTMGSEEVHEEIVKTIENENRFLAEDPQSQALVAQEIEKGFQPVKLDPSEKSAAPNPILEDAYQRTVNRFQSIENLSNDAKKKGVELAPGQDPKLLSRSYLGSAGKARAILEDQTFLPTPEGGIKITGEGFKPILDDLVKNGGGRPTEELREDFNKLLIAKRYVEDLQKLETDKGAVASDEQIEKARTDLDELGKKYGQDLGALEDAANRLYGYQSRVLDYAVDSGVVSQEAAAAMREKHQHYIPFYRVLPEEDAPLPMPVSRGVFSRVKNPVKKIKGSDLEIHDPLESVILNTYRMVDAADRNRVARAVADLADVFPERISPVQEVDSKKATVKGNTVVTYKENGETRYIEVTPALKDAMEGMNEQSLNLLAKILGGPAALKRWGATIAPEFITRNFFRDQFSAFMQTKWGFAPFVDPAYAVADIVGKREVYYDWLRSGAAYSGWIELSRKNLGAELDKMLDQEAAVVKANPLRLLADTGQLLEQSTRVGVFKAALRRGESPMEAGFESREATVDFARRGTGTKEINHIKAFFNANLQANDRMARAFYSDPLGYMVKGLASITTLSLLSYFLMKDDEGYKEIPQTTKDLFWIFKAGGTYWRIPKPYGPGQVFGSVPERLLEFMRTNDTEAFHDLEKSVLSSFSMEPGEMLATAIPDAILPAIENITNHSFFMDRELVPEYKQRLMRSEQYGRHTGEAAKELGKLFNWSPARIENFVSGYLATAGRYGEEALNALVREAKKASGEKVDGEKPKDIADAPVMRGFTVKDPLANPRSVNRLYELKREAETIHLTYKKFTKEGRRDEAAKLKKDPLYRSYTTLRDAAEDVSGIAADLEKVEKSQMPEDEKRRRIASLHEKRLKIAKKALSTVD